jgi:hypothetical protein
VVSREFRFHVDLTSGRLACDRAEWSISWAIGPTFGAPQEAINRLGRQADPIACAAGLTAVAPRRQRCGGMLLLSAFVPAVTSLCSIRFISSRMPAPAVEAGMSRVPYA